MDYKKTLRNRSECFFITSLKTALAPGGRSRGDAARSVFENQSLLAVGVDGDRAVAATLPAEISFRGFIRLICLLLIVFQPEKQDPIIVVIINRRTCDGFDERVLSGIFFHSRDQSLDLVDGNDREIFIVVVYCQRSLPKEKTVRKFQLVEYIIDLCIFVVIDRIARIECYPISCFGKVFNLLNALVYCYFLHE